MTQILNPTPAPPAETSTLPAGPATMVQLLDEALLRTRCLRVLALSRQPAAVFPEAARRGVAPPNSIGKRQQAAALQRLRRRETGGKSLSGAGAVSEGIEVGKVDGKAALEGDLASDGSDRGHFSSRVGVVGNRVGRQFGNVSQDVGAAE